MSNFLRAKKTTHTSAPVSGSVNGTVLYAYDEAGHLLGEYDAIGALIEETVWLRDSPSPIGI